MFPLTAVARQQLIEHEGYATDQLEHSQMCSFSRYTALLTPAFDMLFWKAPDYEQEYVLCNVCVSLCVFSVL